jgi:nucleoside-diphosphate-sugar epimerase
MSPHFLITGFPTFAARHLVQLLLERAPDARLTCVVLPRHLVQARTVAEGWGEPARLTLLEGDVCALDMGLTGAQFKALREDVTEVYHLAALWHTAASPRRLRQVNVEGTRNVILCARDFKALVRFHHLSTAYVCGDREGIIMEEELEEQQRFLNAYEETQYEAERLVRREALPFVIYRPSLIVGHSRTGQIDRLSGPYALIKPLVSLPVDVPLPMPGAGQAPLNMVPVDYVVEALYAIGQQERAVGRTFHLVDPNPMAARRVFELVALTAGRPLPRLNVPEALARALGRAPLLSRIAGVASVQVLGDFNRWSLFNGLNAAELTREGPWCPPLPSYIEPLVRHLVEDDLPAEAVSDFE